MTAFADVAALVENAVECADGQAFASIIGANPSRGARSPALWNAAFAAHGIDARMLPLDVAPHNVEALLEVLDANPCFLGGAVAMPYKEVAARWLDERIALDARAIGAVNCLFRGPQGRLAGTNTDGEGAVRSFVDRFGSAEGRKILLLGAGGAGKAVASFFKRDVGNDGRLVVASRSRSGESLAAALRAEWLPWSGIDAVLETADAVVNCTSVGAAEQIASSPLTPAQVGLLPRRAVVFDIIYQPSPTALLALAEARRLDCLDGRAMNLEQAVLAYGYVAKEPRGPTATRVAMAHATQTPA